MTDDNRDKFNYIAGQYNQTIKFYNIEELCKDRIAWLNKFYSDTFKQRGYWTGIWLRLFIPDILPPDIKKVIYLDSDTVITMDIANYWKIDLEGKMLGVITEKSLVGVDKGVFALVTDSFVKEGKYFNSGSLLINLEKFRAATETIEQGLIFLKDKPKYREYQDQDFLNYCFSEDTLILPPKFNCRVHYLLRKGSSNTDDAIVHYAGHAYGFNVNDTRNKLFFKYFMKTPFHTEQTFGNINASVKQVYNNQKNLMLRVANLFSGKKRVLCVTENNLDRAKKIFAADDSAIITVNPRDSKSLFETFLNMKADQSKSVYIFVVDKYAKIKDYLVKQGLQEWTNFIDGTVFFSEENGGKLNTASMVDDM